MFHRGSLEPWPVYICVYISCFSRMWFWAMANPTHALEVWCHSHEEKLQVMPSWVCCGLVTSSFSNSVSRTQSTKVHLWWGWFRLRWLQRWVELPLRKVSNKCWAIEIKLPSQYMLIALCIPVGLLVHPSEYKWAEYSLQLVTRTLQGWFATAVNGDLFLFI